MKKTSTWILGVAVLAGSFTALTLTATAQTTAPAAAPAVAATPKTVVAKPKVTTAPKSATTAAVSVCKGKDEASCTGGCTWVTPKTANAAGTVAKPYCRTAAAKPAATPAAAPGTAAAVKAPAKVAKPASVTTTTAPAAPKN